ncbi:MAG: nucleotidyltransferase domain-containing protein [Armatimonadetes bacterium]|nr:nucleotidyltransferase domain-containing protein [Armatimonadota bacterium]
MVESMVERLVREFDPDQVILFGSRARGDARADSDVDLLVVMAAVESKREAALAMLLALEGFRVAKDVVVTTSAEYAARRDLVGSVEYPASREGRVMYARSG